MVSLLQRKRDGQELTREDFTFFIDGILSGKIPDYQISAFLMAVYFQGMTTEETATFTDVMMHSGDVIDLSEIPGIKVDKHSTGGVGDKTTLILAPLVAAAGASVAKMSGRGLGHTGGTLDKMESIPGLSVNLSKDQFINQVKNHKLAICGQNESLVPADKKLYALRDVTATVNNLALISSSIMSKKFACGADAIVIDIKVGLGAYMSTVEEAEQLARIMMDIGKNMNREVRVVISAMDQPLGNMVGNALEIKEVIQVLQGDGPADLRELVIGLGSHMLVLAKIVGNIEEGARLLSTLIADGSGLNKFAEMVEAQGGDVAVIEKPSLITTAKYKRAVISKSDGFITEFHALKVGLSCVKLGAGRETKSSEIDHSAGIVLRKKLGDRVEKNEELAMLYSNDETRLAAAESLMYEAIVIGESKANAKPIILKEIV